MKNVVRAPSTLLQNRRILHRQVTQVRKIMDHSFSSVQPLILPERPWSSCASSRQQALLGRDSFISKPPTATSSTSRVAAAAATLRPGTPAAFAVARAAAALAAAAPPGESRRGDAAPATVVTRGRGPRGLVALRGRRYPLALRISSAGACSALCSTRVMSWCSICFHSVSQPLPPRYRKMA